MAWFAYWGIDQKTISVRTERFRRLFEVPGVPSLHLDCFLSNQYISYWGWSWNSYQIPDCSTFSSEDAFIASNGIVTEIDSKTPLAGENGQAVSQISHIWREFNDRFVNRLNGSFSLFIYDRKSESVHLYTDRFASRSVCICREGAGWIAGDIPSVVAVLQSAASKLDLAGLWSYLHLGRRVGNHSLFHGIRYLQAGQRLVTSKDGNETLFNWRQRRYQPDWSVSPREWGTRLASAINTSASRYRQVCRRPTLFLSGGLDSRIAAGALNEGARTVTLCTMPNAESRTASRVADVLGLEHETMIRSPYWYLDTTRAATWISAGSHLNHHCHFFVPVGIISAQHPETEYFLGDLLENFNKHYFHIPSGLHPKFNVDFVSDELPKFIPSTIKDPARIGMYLQPVIRDRAREAYRQAVQESVTRFFEVSPDVSDCLNELLRWGDVSSTYTFNMITSIRAMAPERNIRLDNDLDDLSVFIPSVIRGAGQLHRWTLRSLAPDLMWIPDSNYFVPPVFPEWMRRSIKSIRPIFGRVRRSVKRLQDQPLVLSTSGSWLLLHEMYRRDDRYKSHIKNVLQNSRKILNELIDFSKVDQTWLEFENGNLGRRFEIESLFSLCQLVLAMEYPAGRLS